MNEKRTRTHTKLQLLTFSHRQCETLVPGFSIWTENPKKNTNVTKKKKKEIIKYIHIFFCLLSRTNKTRSKADYNNEWQGNDFLKEQEKKKFEIGKKMAGKKLTKGEKEENDTKHNKDDNIFISFAIFQCSLHPKC